MNTERVKQLEQLIGTETFTKVCVSALNKLLVNKGIITEEELKEVMSQELTLAVVDRTDADLRSAKETDINASFRKYFESLGYKVNWDRDTRMGQEWYEIYTKNGELVAQIDCGVPLEDVICDLISFHTGEDSKSTFKGEYIINVAENELTKELFKRVFENEYFKKAA